MRVWGGTPSGGPGAEPPVGGKGRNPLKLKAFEHLVATRGGEWWEGDTWRDMGVWGEALSEVQGAVYPVGLGQSLP